MIPDTTMRRLKKWKHEQELDISALKEVIKQRFPTARIETADIDAYFKGRCDSETKSTLDRVAEKLIAEDIVNGGEVEAKTDIVPLKRSKRQPKVKQIWSPLKSTPQKYKNDKVARLVLSELSSRMNRVEDSSSDSEYADGDFEEMELPKDKQQESRKIARGRPKQNLYSARCSTRKRKYHSPIASSQRTPTLPKAIPFSAQDNSESKAKQFEDLLNSLALDLVLEPSSNAKVSSKKVNDEQGNVAKQKLTTVPTKCDPRNKKVEVQSKPTSLKGKTEEKTSEYEQTPKRAKLVNKCVNGIEQTTPALTPVVSNKNRKQRYNVRDVVVRMANEKKLLWASAEESKRIKEWTKSGLESFKQTPLPSYTRPLNSIPLMPIPCNVGAVSRLSLH